MNVCLFISGIKDANCVRFDVGVIEEIPPVPGQVV